MLEKEAARRQKERKGTGGGGTLGEGQTREWGEEGGRETGVSERERRERREERERKLREKTDLRPCSSGPLVRSLLASLLHKHKY